MIRRYITKIVDEIVSRPGWFANHNKQLDMFADNPHSSEFTVSRIQNGYIVSHPYGLPVYCAQPNDITETFISIESRNKVLSTGKSTRN